MSTMSAAPDLDSHDAAGLTGLKNFTPAGWKKPARSKGYLNGARDVILRR